MGRALRCLDQHLARPALTLAQVTAEVPETPHGADRLHRRLEVTVVDRPPQRRADVVVLSCHAIESVDRRGEGRCQLDHELAKP